MGAPGTSYWTGSVLVYNTSSGGMSVYLDDETGAVGFGSYLGKQCSTNTVCNLFLRPLARLIRCGVRCGNHFLVVQLTSGWVHVFRSLRFNWTAATLSQSVPFGRLHEPEALPPLRDESTREACKQNRKSILMLVHRPTEKATFHKKRVTKTTFVSAVGVFLCRGCETGCYAQSLFCICFFRIFCLKLFYFFSTKASQQAIVQLSVGLM